MSVFSRRAAVAAPLALVTSAMWVPLAGAADAFDPNTTAQADSPVVINEVESNGDPVEDWVELANTDENNAVDISGWRILDDDDDHDPIVIPDGTEIESGGYAAFYTTGKQRPKGPSKGFGLGGNDSVRVYDKDGARVDETTWEGHAETTWGRVPDMTGDFAVTGEPTRGARNVEAGEKEPVADEAWPFDPQDIHDITVGNDAAGAFQGEDMSGVDFDAHGTAWVVNNDRGQLYALTRDGADWSIAGAWQLRYADGTGQPDAEGVTVGPDGDIYVATERNNEDKNTSHPAVLRFAAPELSDNGEDLAADGEWNFGDVVGDIGANAGLEAISYVGDGTFAVGVEASGEVIIAKLGDAGNIDVRQRYDSPFDGVMALDYRAEDGQLRVLCDEACEGASIVLAEKGGQFEPVSDVQARPQNMGNFANEGYASFTEAGGTTYFLWADDGVSDGVSLRGATSEKGSDSAAGAGGPASSHLSSNLSSALF